MKKTVPLYIFKEVLHIFLVGLMVFTIVLLMDKILRLIELIVNRGASTTQILMLLFFISPSFLIFTIPVSVLLGTLLTFGRLSGDNEITAFKASGISVYQLFLPIFIFSFGAYLLTTFLVFYGLPWGNRGFKATLFLMARSKASIEIKERVFNDSFEGLVVYVDKVPVDGEKMEGVLIYDERERERSNTIFAKEGFLINNPNSQEITLRLLKGDIHRLDPKNHVYQKVQFETYDLKLELSKVLTAIGKKLSDKEMSIDEVKDKIRTLEQKGEDTTALKMEVHNRYAFPFACIVFAFIGVPLGIQSRRSGRSSGFIFSIVILMLYYMSLTAAETLVARRVIPPALGAWMPNLLIGALGTYLLVKAANDSPFKPLLWLNEGIDFLQRRWKRVSENV